MTVMPSLRLAPQDAEDVATYLISLKKQQPSSYADASFMDDPNLKDEGKKWVRHFGCAGCHEISGLEEEGRIGTELTIEGSKPIERMDFALLTDIQTTWRVCPKAQPKTRGTTRKASSSTSSPNRTSGIMARTNPKPKSYACRICISQKNRFARSPLFY
jgi:hypothetical protein